MKLYYEGAAILDSVLSRKGSPKALVLSSKYKNKKQLYALVCEALKYNETLTQILAPLRLMKHERVLSSESLTKVLVYDLLFGKGVHGAGKLQSAVLRHKTSIQAELARLKIKKNVIHNEDLLSNAVKLQGQMPRYVRINKLKTTLEEVISTFKRYGFELLVNKCKDSASFFHLIREMKAGQFTVDRHVSDLLVFPCGTDFHAHTLYKAGHIILQDKASCFPAYILNPLEGSHAIDCCAAPGNKTSHMASIMCNKGKIFAFDKDPSRLATMKSLLKQASVTCAEVCCQDFLSVDVKEEKFSNVRYVVVDPSCSGSGIISRQDASNSDCSQERLQSLSKFQVSILKHALSFPNVERVVYSTCSIHQEENEQVVNQVLMAYGGLYHLDYIMPDWPVRGIPVFPSANCCLRFTPEQVLTNGFFVACFKKNVNGESVENVMPCLLPKGSDSLDDGMPYLPPGDSDIPHGETQCLPSDGSCAPKVTMKKTFKNSSNRAMKRKSRKRRQNKKLRLQ